MAAPPPGRPDDDQATQVTSAPADLLAAAGLRGAGAAPLGSVGDVFSNATDSFADLPPPAPAPAPISMADAFAVPAGVSFGDLPPTPAGADRTLERGELNEDEFASLLKGNLGGGMDAMSALESPGEGFVVVPKGVPPPLKGPAPRMTPPPIAKAPPLPAAPPLLRPSAPPVPAKPKVDTDPAKLLAGLAAIPSVGSLGGMPKLGDGISFLKVLGVLLLALAVGAGAGVALVPEPPPPATTGPAGAKVKLTEARRLLSLGQDAAAMGLLETAITLDPKLGEAQRDLGVVYARQERWEDAARAYQAYLDLVPNAPDRGTVETTVKKFRGQK